MQKSDRIDISKRFGPCSSKHILLEKCSVYHLLYSTSTAPFKASRQYLSSSHLGIEAQQSRKLSHMMMHEKSSAGRNLLEFTFQRFSKQVRRQRYYYKSAHSIIFCIRLPQRKASIQHLSSSQLGIEAGQGHVLSHMILHTKTSESEI